MGTDVFWKGRGRGKLPIQWPEVLLRWRFLHSGKPLEPLFSTIKYNQGKEQGAGREWGSERGSQTSPRDPLCPSRPCPLPVPPDRQPDIHPCSLLCPSPAANTAGVSQRLDFSPWRGTPQLLVAAINPEQLKQQEDNGAVPASPPRLLLNHLGRELPELLRYRSGAPPPGIPGIRAGARRLFCSTAKKERSLSSLSSLSTWSCPVSQPEILFPFPHRITCQERAEPSSDTFSPPTNNF